MRCAAPLLVIAAAAACQPSNDAPMNGTEVAALVDTATAIADQRLALLNARDIERLLFLYAADPYSASDGVMLHGRAPFEQALRSLIASHRAINLVKDLSGVQVQARNQANVFVDFHGTMTDSTGRQDSLRGVWTAAIHRNRNGWLIHTEHTSTVRTSTRTP